MKLVSSENQNEAKYHKTCNNKYKKFHLNRCINKKRAKTNQKKYVQSQQSVREELIQVKVTLKCVFFCNKNDSLQSLHQASALKTGKRVRE